VVAHARLGQELLSEREGSGRIAGQERVLGIGRARSDMKRHGSGPYTRVGLKSEGAQSAYSRSALDLRLRVSLATEQLTKKELKEILDTVLREIDRDPDEGPRLRAVAAPLRIEFPDLKLVVNVRPDDGGKHCLRWDFAQRAKAHPRLRLSMESAVANRVFQGRENPAIAIARGRLRTSIEDPAAALRFFPAAKPLFSRYRELVSEKYPHLAVD
jgi:hypothetical protein